MSTYDINAATNTKFATLNDNGYSSGDGSLTVTCDGEYKGRTKRVGTASITTDGNGATATLTVEQNGPGEYVEFDAVSAVAASATSVTVTGKTNAASLTFSKTDVSSIATLPSTYTVTYGSPTTTISNISISGGAITDDPGADQEINFSITITLTVNTASSSRSFTLTVTPPNATAQTITITQSAGDDYICFDSVGGSTTKTVTFNNKGKDTVNNQSSVTVTVKSNDDWTITPGSTSTSS